MNSHLKAASQDRFAAFEESLPAEQRLFLKRAKVDIPRISESWKNLTLSKLEHISSRQERALLIDKKDFQNYFAYLVMGTDSWLIDSIRPLKTDDKSRPAATPAETFKRIVASAKADDRTDFLLHCSPEFLEQLTQDDNGSYSQKEVNLAMEYLQRSALISTAKRRAQVSMLERPPLNSPIPLPPKPSPLPI